MELEVFRAGKHTDSSGRIREWTEEDLDTIVRKYRPAEHEAPVVIGHPETNSPAWGWTEGLRREGQVLYAKLKDLAPEFRDWLSKKRYKKRSISIYPDMTLRHIGFLGGMPPAVKGLTDASFKDNRGAVTMEFEEYRVPIIGRILSRLRDFFIDIYDIETADRVIGEWEIEELKRDITESEQSAAFADGEFSEEEDMDKSKEIEAKIEEKDRQIAEFSEQTKTKDEEIARLRAEKRRLEFSSFCDELEQEGKLTPAMRPAVLDFMEILHGNGEYEFAEGEGKVKAQPLERFKAFIKGIPKQVDFSEQATKGRAGEKGGNGASHDFSGTVDEERLEIHKKAINLSEKEGIPYREAVDKVTKEA